MCACVCVRVYACVHACNVCVCAYVRAFMRACICACVLLCVCVRVSARAGVCRCVFVCVFVLCLCLYQCLYQCLYLCVCLFCIADFFSCKALVSFAKISPSGFFQIFFQKKTEMQGHTQFILGTKYNWKKESKIRNIENVEKQYTFKAVLYLNYFN